MTVGITSGGSGLQADGVLLGKRLRELRKERGWTLAEVSKRTGLAISTVSKVERGEMSPTYDKFMRLAHGLGLDVGELFAPGGRPFAPGTFGITRSGKQKRHETGNYVYDMLCADLRNKQMIPMLGRVKAHDFRSFDDFIRHPGEEFLFVLKGTLTVHREGAEPVVLEPFDSVYFDSNMGHAYVSTGEEDAEMLVVCWESEPSATAGGKTGDGEEP